MRPTTKVKRWMPPLHIVGPVTLHFQAKNYLAASLDIGGIPYTTADEDNDPIRYITYVFKRGTEELEVHAMRNVNTPHWTIALSGNAAAHIDTQGVDLQDCSELHLTLPGDWKLHRYAMASPKREDDYYQGEDGRSTHQLKILPGPRQGANSSPAR
jgi:hypothetical protein